VAYLKKNQRKDGRWIYMRLGGDFKIGGINRNGYRRSQFDAPFAAYFPPNAVQPPFQTSTSSTAVKDQEKTAFQTSTSALPGRSSEEEISKEEQSGRGGRPLKPPVGANGQGRGPISDYDTVIEELNERSELADDDPPELPAFLDRRAEASRVCAQCGEARLGDLPTVAVTTKDGTIVYVHEHGCLRFWKKENGDAPAVGDGGAHP